MTEGINTVGLGMAFVCLGLIIVQFAVHKFVKKVTNTYGFGLGVGAFVFIGLIVFRFAGGGANYMANSSKLDGTQYSDANEISKAFLLDICPFMSLFLPLSLIIDPSRKLAKAAAPLALIGGLLIVFIQMPGENMPSQDTYPVGSLEGIFLGGKEGKAGPNPCYYIMHASNMFLAIGVMLNTPKYGVKGYLSCVAVAAVYYSYVAIAAQALNCQGFVSGLNINDGSSTGEYGIVAREILHTSPQVAAGLTFPLCFLICSGFMALKDFVFCRGIGSYGDVFSGKGYAGYDYNKFLATNHK